MRSLNRVILTDRQLEALRTTIIGLKYEDYKPASKKLGVTPKTVHDLAVKAVEKVTLARTGEARLAKGRR